MKKTIRNEYRIPVLIAALLLTITSTLAGQELPLLLQERYLMAHIGFQRQYATSYEYPDDISLGYTIFNGEFPVVIHAEGPELSLYSGSPLFIPAFLSGGTTNQIGYIDAYSNYTPIALLSLGWRHDLLKTGNLANDGFFASWGWRAGILSGGLGYHFAHERPVGYLGVSLDNLGVSLSASPVNLKAILTYRTEKSWSISTSMELDEHGQASFGIGFGLSRKDYAAESIFTDDWSMSVAHRGSLLHAPENTNAAFEWALEQPRYVAIETDIQLTADGKFLLIHDPILLRYNHGFDMVGEMTSEQLKSLDMGSWFSSDFAGAQVLDLAQLGEISNANPDVYWLLELKNLAWTREEAKRFLTEIDEEFDHPEKIGFYTVTLEMMELMQSLTDRPVGIQLDTVKMMLYYSDHLMPLVKAEYRPLVRNADFFTLLSSKFDREEQLIELSEELGIPVMLWNFHDIIAGYIPKDLRRYPLGMPKMLDGALLKE